MSNRELGFNGLRPWPLATTGNQPYSQSARGNQPHSQISQTAKTLRDLADAFGELGDEKKQQELLERALKIFHAFYGADHQITRRSISALQLLTNSNP